MISLIRVDFASIRPMRKECQFCNLEVVTYVEHEVNRLFGLICCVTFFIFGLLAFIILPIVFFLTKNAVHRCSRCLQRMGEKSCFGLPDDFNAPVRFLLARQPFLLFLDLALPSRQVLHRHGQDLRSHRADPVCHRQLLLRLYAPIV